MSSQSTQSVQRELYMLTRSEATWLVNTYMNAMKKGADGSIEPYRVFRDALETDKPAYLGKFNNSNNASVQGAFYKIAGNLHNMLNELNRRVSDTDHYQKTMDAAKLLPCKHSIAYLTGTFLNWAVYNWHMKTSYPVAEDLGDNGYECNSCSVCNFSGESLFFFSTSYGLEKPVCEKCISYEDYDAPTAKEIKNDPDYEVSEEESEEEYEMQNEVVDEKDPDYVPSDESECEEEYDSGDDDDAESNTTEETDLIASESESESDASASESDASASESDSDTSASESESDASDCESEKMVFGCDGCNYEWRAGFKHGYKTAMKKVRNYADYHKHTKPDVPNCETCGMSYENLKKCGRCYSVRYCSDECQRDDWPLHKRVCRREE
jgi:hypothetical protein